MRKAIVNCRLFDGEQEHVGLAVIVEDGQIVDIVDEKVAESLADEAVDCDGLQLVPGFIDLQVNGGGGVLFNDAPTVDTLRTIVAAHRPLGTTACLPTLITDDPETMRAAIDAVREAIGQGVPGVIGIHLEGPHLNPERRGVHDASQMRGLDGQALELLSSLEIGRTIVTLAPERVIGESIRQLTERGVRVFAGHSAATYDEVRAAIDCGLIGFTHLFNAMSPFESRSPGMVGTALSDPASYAGLICDASSDELRQAFSMANPKEEEWTDKSRGPGARDEPVALARTTLTPSPIPR